MTTRTTKKLGRNPFQKTQGPDAKKTSTAAPEVTPEAADGPFGLPSPKPLIRALVTYLAAEAALAGARLLDLADAVLNAKKRAV